MQISYEDRISLIKAILLSDYQYKDMLLSRLTKALEEVTSLQILIAKKEAEIEGMELQLKFARAIQ